MNANRLLLAALIVGVVVWAWLTFGSSDEAKIRAGFGAVADLISKAEGESALESADRARQLGERFVEPFTLQVDEVGVTVTQRAELVRPFVGLRHQARRIDVDFSDIEIEVDGRVARAAARADVSGTIGGSPRRGSWQIQTRWHKVGRDWRLERFHVGERLDGGLFR